MPNSGGGGGGGNGNSTMLILSIWFIQHVLGSMMIKTQDCYDRNMFCLMYCYFVGHYIYLETSTPTRQYDTADLYSPPYSYKDTVCITFWYHMYGSSVGELFVYLTEGDKSAPTKMWQLKGQ